MAMLWKVKSASASLIYPSIELSASAWPRLTPQILLIRSLLGWYRALLGWYRALMGCYRALLGWYGAILCLMWGCISRLSFAASYIAKSRFLQGGDRAPFGLIQGPFVLYTGLFCALSRALLCRILGSSVHYTGLFRAPDNDGAREREHAGTHEIAKPYT